MALQLVPTTELDAVNFMLSLIGEQPISTLNSAGFNLASLAQQKLHAVSRKVQAMGLYCNSEENYPLPVDVDGYIQIPPNTLDIDASDSNVEVVQRGSRLYDRASHTYKFTDGINVDIVFFLAFEELPEIVREYITIRAGREFQVENLGSTQLHQLTQEQEEQAWVKLLQFETDSADYNIFNNQDVANIFKR